MTITNGYATLDEIRFYLGYSTGSSTSDDPYLEATVQSVSRMIDDSCRRRFYTTTSDEVRYFTASTPMVVFVDDINTLTKIEIDDGEDRTYSVELQSTDYDAYPLNYAVKSLPIEWIQIAPDGDYSFSTIAKGVKITGKFGYCALASVPDQIKQACIIQTARIYKRAKEAPFGVVGASDMGQAVVIPKLDPDVDMLLQPFRRKII